MGILAKRCLEGMRDHYGSMEANKGNKNCGECQPYYYVNLLSTLRLPPAAS